MLFGYTREISSYGQLHVEIYTPTKSVDITNKRDVRYSATTNYLSQDARRSNLNNNLLRKEICVRIADDQCMNNEAENLDICYNRMLREKMME